jgi:hypothetical protein
MNEGMVTWVSLAYSLRGRATVTLLLGALLILYNNHSRLGCAYGPNQSDNPTEKSPPEKHIQYQYRAFVTAPSGKGDEGRHHIDG